MEKDKLYDVADHFFGITFAKLLYEEGISSKNIESYTKDELKTLLITHNKFRGKNTIGIKFYEWPNLLELSQELLGNKITNT